MASIRGIKKMTPLMRGLGAAVFSGLSATTFGLGVWQFKRFYEKEDQIIARESLLHAPVKPISNLLIDALTEGNQTDIDTHANQRDIEMPNSIDFTSQLFKKFRCEGKFEDGVVILGPRSPPKHTDIYDNKKPGSASGFYIFSPFRCNDGRFIVICRGWIPRSEINRNPATKWKVSEDPRRALTTTVTGVLRNTEKKARFSPDAEISKNHMKPSRFYWLDIDGIATALGIRLRNSSPVPKKENSVVEEDVYIDLLPNGEIYDTSSKHTSKTTWFSGLWGTSTIDNNTIAIQSNDFVPIAKPLDAHKDFYTTTFTHAGYSATWFSLSFCCFALTFLKFRR